MSKAVALIESTEGAWSASVTLPNGRKSEFHFREKTKGDGHFVCEVPTEMTYVDDFKNTKQFHPNFAQHLIDSYPFLRLVKVTEAPDVKESIVKDRPAVVDAKTHAQMVADGVKAELARIESEKKSEAERLATETKDQRERMQENLKKARAAKSLEKV